MTLLKTKNELLQTIQQVGAELLNFPWENKTCYSHWIAQTYFYVRHTTSFLALSAQTWGIKNRERQYQALSHLKQELKHDLLLVEDLMHLQDSIEQHAEWPETQAFYQTQYYWIERESPMAHLGYAYLLEGMAHTFGSQIYKKITLSHGSNSSTFLKVHATEDVEHFEEGLVFLEKMNEFELRVFSECLRQAALLYCLILKKAKSIDSGL